MLDIYASSQRELAYAREIRRHLHRHPEPSGYEFETVRYIRTHLEKLGISYVNIPDGGILACIDSGRSGKAVLLRADCDALRMQEAPENAKKRKICVSETPGLAHTCGHDSHVAMLLAAGKILTANRDAFSGKIYLLFERGEEGGQCIYYVMRYIQEKGIHIDSCWSNHVTPDFPAGVVAIADGPTNAALFNYEIGIIGKGGHASRPDRANNPIHCFHAVMGRLHDYRMRCTSPFVPMTFDICSVHSGTACNVIPDTLCFSGTCRYFDRELGLRFKEYLRKAVDECCSFYECIPEYRQFSELCIPAVNNCACAQLAKRAAIPLLGEKQVLPREPRMGSESFSVLTACYPSARGAIGAGNVEEGITCSNHHPGFEIDENGMVCGIMMNIAYALLFLKEAPDIDFQPFAGTIDDLFASMNTDPPARHDISEADI